MTEFLWFLTAVLLHELGHILCARLLGIPLNGCSVRPCGALLTFDFSRTSYFREGCVHLAGAGTGILSAVLALRSFGEPAEIFSGISVVLAAVNLLPVRGFDGGGVLHCLLSAVLPPELSEKICRTVSLIVLLLLWTAVLWVELRVRADAAMLCFVLYVMIFQTEIVNFT